LKIGSQKALPDLPHRSYLLKIAGVSISRPAPRETGRLRDDAQYQSPTSRSKAHERQAVADHLLLCPRKSSCSHTIAAYHPELLGLDSMLQNHTY
jgi:hypothetical protein